MQVGLSTLVPTASQAICCAPVLLAEGWQVVPHICLGWQMRVTLPFRRRRYARAARAFFAPRIGVRSAMVSFSHAVRSTNRGALSRIFIK